MPQDKLKIESSNPESTNQRLNYRMSLIESYLADNPHTLRNAYACAKHVKIVLGYAKTIIHNGELKNIMKEMSLFDRLWNYLASRADEEDDDTAPTMHEMKDLYAYLQDAYDMILMVFQERGYIFITDEGKDETG